VQTAHRLCALSLVMASIFGFFGCRKNDHGDAPAPLVAGHVDAPGGGEMELPAPDAGGSDLPGRSLVDGAADGSRRDDPWIDSDIPCGGCPQRPQKPLQIREGTIFVDGKLPPEMIQRTVRQNFGRFGRCYGAALENKPTLAGRVEMKFVIDKDGNVSRVVDESDAIDGGAALPDKAVRQCVVRGFGGLYFPPPQSGEVVVKCAILLSPGRRAAQ
jgi:hypothetical protein